MSRSSGDKYASRRGVTLMEVLVGTALFAIIAYALYASFANLLDITVDTKLVASATEAIESEIEIIRNLPYQSVGIVGGWPSGVLPAALQLTHNGVPFVLTITVRNIDDPFDGTMGGTPPDNAPADYKLVEITASCLKCKHFVPVTMTARVAPPGFETASSGGSLIIQVFDANGNPIQGANVTVSNMSTTPTLTIYDTTNSSGVLKLVDVPTSTERYGIIVSKSGYSTDQNYMRGAAANPNPVHPYASVFSGSATTESFAIDRLSSLSLLARGERCTAVSGFDASLTGRKTIGLPPSLIFKYPTTTAATNAQGTAAFNSLEWDTYILTPADAALDVAGYNPDAGWSVVVAPSSSMQVPWLVAPRSALSLLVTITDASGTRLSDATTTLSLGGFSATARTGIKDLKQTSWSGSGATGYSSKSEGIDTSVPDSLTLALNASGTYNTGAQEWLISNTFDLGTANDERLTQLSWTPVSQPPPSGAQPVKFQLAANNDNSTWNFTGPNGMADSYYATSGIDISGLNGKRYLRYKVFLSTEQDNQTPSVSGVDIGYGSECIPDGQAFFSGLLSGTYTLTVKHAGFYTTSTSVGVTSTWQEKIVPLQAL